MIQLEKTFDVAAVERKLAELWTQSTAEIESEDAAVLRARVANLIVFVASESLLKEVADSMQSLTAAHPGRVLMLLGDKQAPDRDIEMFVASLCQTDKRTGVKRLCGEEVTLKAQGKFVIELPSASVPLLVSDLSTFLWWRDRLDVSDEVLQRLLSAADRLVIDSVDFKQPALELAETNKLFQDDSYRSVAVSDLNWERLTLWRALLADFYDVPSHQPWLERIDTVRIEFAAPEADDEAVSPQALLIAGWLASRLGWTIDSNASVDRTRSLTWSTANGQTVTVQLNRTVTRAKPGRLVKIELSSKHEATASFVVARSEDNRHILAEARIGSEIKRGRLLPVRNRSTAELLAREMEILCNDRIYQKAVNQAVTIFHTG